MKKFIFSFMLFALGACKDDTSEALTNEQAHCVSKDVTDTLSGVSGRVDKLANAYVIRTSLQTYYACNLPESFKSPGHTIRFDAEVYRIPENVRLIGIPILLTRIY